MEVSEIFGECKKLGILLEVKDSRLHFDASEGIMTPELKAKIIRQKKEIIEGLHGEYSDSFIQSAIIQLKDAGVDLMKLSQKIRTESLMLEVELTKAWHRKDINTYKELVTRWQDMLLHDRMD